MKADVGVTVARFQVPSLTLGHQHLLDAVANHKHMVVFLGVSPIRFSKRDPLPYSLREQMVMTTYPSALVLPLDDQPNNASWSQNLDHALATHFPNQSVRLYAGRDGFLPYYKGIHPMQEVLSTTCPSGTEVRNQCGKVFLDHSEPFRRGIICGIENTRARMLQTVDIAIVRDEPPSQLYVLMARKAVEEKPEGFRFIGGFVDPTDVSLERAAMREASEETHVELGYPRYIASVPISDWRYRKSPEGIMTAFFAAKYAFGVAKASDDIVGVRWIPMNELIRFTLPIHRPLAELLVDAYRKDPHYAR